MAKKDSISANMRYHRRQKKHDYRLQTRLIWTLEMVKYIYEFKGIFPDHVFAKKFGTSICAIRHIFNKINKVNKMKISESEKLKLVLTCHWKVLKNMVEVKPLKKTAIAILDSETKEYIDFCDKINL